jgi:hypothetical protein
MTPFFFGYGSLVNRATHPYENAHRASARGWKRAWRYTNHRDIAFLTAIPCPNSEIKGLMAEVPNGDWIALDKREFAYDRVPASDQIDHSIEIPHEVSIYAIPNGQHIAPSERHPILLSYLEVVVQGYLNEFGKDGVAEFFDTTDGWDAPILDDRAAPLYPRFQSLSRAEKALTESHMTRMNCRLIERR